MRMGKRQLKPKHVFLACEDLRPLGGRPGKEGMEVEQGWLEGNPEHISQSEEGSTLYDFDTIPEAMWSDNRENHYARRELSSLGIIIRKEVRGTHLEEPDC